MSLYMFKESLTSVPPSTGDKLRSRIGKTSIKPRGHVQNKNKVASKKIYKPTVAQRPSKPGIF